MNKLDAMAEPIADAKPHIVTIDRISLRAVAIAIVAVLELVESSGIIRCHLQQLWLIGGITAIRFSIWALNLFGRLSMRAIAPARLSYLRLDLLCC